MRTHITNKHYAAFTLAEVLITLGIIGIVAAMTLPTLTAKYQQKILQSQFKKSYTNMQNAINLINAENGIPYECYMLQTPGAYYYDECNKFWNEFLGKYKAVKICENNQTSCRPRYKTKAEVLAEGGSIRYTSCSLPVNEHTGYNLNDGSTIYLYSGNGSFAYHNSVFFAIDVNGLKGPNKWGYDLFYLNLFRKNANATTLAMTTICELLEKGGESAEAILLK